MSPWIDVPDLLRGQEVMGETLLDPAHLVQPVKLFLREKGYFKAVELFDSQPADFVAY